MGFISIGDFGDHGLPLSTILRCVSYSSIIDVHPVSDVHKLGVPWSSLFSRAVHCHLSVIHVGTDIALPSKCG